MTPSTSPTRSSSGWTRPRANRRVAFRLAELAERVGGRVAGDPERRVEAIRALEAAGPRDLSFVTQARFRARALASGAGALLVGADLKEAAGLGRDLVVAPRPALALAQLIALFHPDRGE